MSIAVAPPGELPEPRRRAARGGPRLERLALRLSLVTPVLGGAPVPRTIDEVDIVRAPSIRGQLRFWWRALHAQEFATARELLDDECALFGRAADEDGGRSPVELRVAVEHAGAVDRDEVLLFPGKAGPATPGAYALFPARAEAGGTPTAPRRKPGTRFTLELRAPAEQLDRLREVVRAWILFGGYGSRTRRGLGSLGVLDEREAWLPKDASRQALAALFGRDVFAPAEARPGDVPRLAGATLLVGEPKQAKDLGVEGALSAAERSWLTALHWLRDFRQAVWTGARQPGKGKPSLSNWPEADKIRQLVRARWTHGTRHGSDPAWPRAGFGLPIIFHFLGEGPGRTGLDLGWVEPSGTVHDRLASPLIVKAMPLANGQFVPIALWLARSWPEGAEVVLRLGGKIVQNSVAPFDKLLGKGDKAEFPPLAGKTSLREAFLDWLAKAQGVKRIAG